MKRDLWTSCLLENHSPAYPCPHCKNSTLLILPETFHKKETVASKQARSDEGWDPDWITYCFSVRLKCNSSACGQEVVMVGRGSQERHETFDEEGNPEENWRAEFQPHFCLPMPDIFELPEKCPNEVKTELRAAFRLFWSDQAASAGRVRVSLERLMDHYRIPRRRKKQDKKYHSLNLHGRIEAFSKNNSGAGKKLMALKWLGNTASHQGDVSRDDILKGFVILEYLLSELFEERAARVEELTRQLTKKYAPHRRR